jgi:hypothetical protein
VFAQTETDNMTEMTISQALRRMKKLKGQIAEHLDRATRAVSYAEKSPPAFDFAKCMEAAGAVRAELVALDAAVAVANATTELEFDGARMPLVQAVKTLQELKGQITWVKALPVQAQAEIVVETTEYAEVNGDYKHVRVEKKHMCALPEAKRAELTASLQDRFDRLNDAVETKNHRAAIAAQ